MVSETVMIDGEEGAIEGGYEFCLGISQILRDDLFFVTCFFLSCPRDLNLSDLGLDRWDLFSRFTSFFLNLSNQSFVLTQRLIGILKRLRCNMIIGSINLAVGPISPNMSR